MNPSRFYPLFVRFLDRFLDRQRVKSLLWPVAFWIWTAGVSLWIDTVPVEETPPLPFESKFGNIEFHGIVFNQNHADSAGIALDAPRALFDGEKGILYIDHPHIQWKDPGKGIVFSATAAAGEFKSHTGASALPSAFQYLDLRGQAQAAFQSNRVDSERMLFDNENRLFVFPDPFHFKGEKVSSRLKQMYYNPFTQKLDLISKVPKINPALKTALSDEVHTKP